MPLREAVARQTKSAGAAEMALSNLLKFRRNGRAVDLRNTIMAAMSREAYLRGMPALHAVMAHI